MQARGYDDLTDETRARFDGTHIASLEPDALRTALASSATALIQEAKRSGLPNAGVVAERIAELAS